MSSWVEKQQQEAFSLYRVYLGISLHFKEGSSYDYTLYGGNTKSTLEAFLRKDRATISRFIQLKNKLRGIPVEEFLFSNARNNNLHINTLLDGKAFDNYRRWHQSYGTPEAFENSVKSLLREQYADRNSFKGMEDILSHLLLSGDRYLEAVAWLLQRSSDPDLQTNINIRAENNALIQVQLQRAMRLQKFYSYFGTI